jgi:hypothetical protein
MKGIELRFLTCMSSMSKHAPAGGVWRQVSDPAAISLPPVSWACARITGEHDKQLLRRRSELVERSTKSPNPFALLLQQARHLRRSLFNSAMACRNSHYRALA